MGHIGNIEVKGFGLDLDQARLTSGDLASGQMSVPLTRTEFEIVKILVEAAGRIVSKPYLVDAVFRKPVNENTVEVFITYIRNKLESIGADPNSLITRRGFGYMVEKAVV